MTTYTVDFHSDADYAIREFKARSPEDALRKARAFYDAHRDELMFTGYDGGQAVNEIVVRDADRNAVATWHDDDMRLRLAASDLLEAAELALRELRSFYSDGESEALRVLGEVIVKAKGARP